MSSVKFHTRGVRPGLTAAGALVLLVCALRPGVAQVATAELSGTVVDPTGAALPNAAVTAMNAATNVIAREARTGGSGEYVMTLLPPGNYTVTVEAPGFRKLQQTGVTLQVNQRAQLDLRLEVGQVTETVEVQGVAPLLESQSSSLGSVIGEQFVSELPLNGRNFVQLAILSPGVNGTGFSTQGTIQSGARPDDRRPGTEIFSNGNREGSNNFLFDGVDNNERLIQLIVYRPSVEAIREFKVQTNMFSADVGRNSGAVVDVITKSGTNSLHGSTFYFHRNSAMDAQNFFSRPGSPVPPFRYNQYGFAVGGPVIRNKTFWFVDYEGFRRSLLNTSTRTVPTLAMRQGDFSGQPNAIYDPLTTVAQGSGFVRTPFPNNRIPNNRWDPVTAKLMNAYPAPQTTGLANNYVSELSQTQDWDQGDVRIDHQFTPNDNFFARWSIQHTTTFAPNTFPEMNIPGVSRPVGVGNEDSFAGPAFNPVQHVVASYVKVLSPRLVNDFRVGFNRFVLDYTDVSATAGGALGNELGVPNANGHPLQSVFPIFSPAGYTGVGHSRSLPIFRRSNSFQYTDNVTYTTGPHTIKFGGAFIRRQITEYQTNRGNGRFNFSAAFTDSRQGGATGHPMASFLLGYANLIEQDYTLAWTGQRGWENGLYIADDWRVNKRLTLNLGLRWEYYSPYTEVADRIASFDLASATMKIAGRDGVDRRLGVERDFKNWAPRFGFAFRLAEHSVLRGGYGLFYNPNGNGGALMRLFRHVPFGPVYSVVPGDVFVGPRVSDGFPAPPTVDFATAADPYGVVFSVRNDSSPGDECQPGRLGRLKQLQRPSVLRRQAIQPRLHDAARLHVVACYRQRGHRIRRRHRHAAGPALPELRPEQFRLRHPPPRHDFVHLSVAFRQGTTVDEPGPRQRVCLRRLATERDHHLSDRAALHAGAVQSKHQRRWRQPAGRQREPGAAFRAALHQPLVRYGRVFAAQRNPVWQRRAQHPVRPRACEFRHVGVQALPHLRALPARAARGGV